MRNGNLASAAHRIVRGVPFTDGLMTFDQATIDSAGVFLVGELERLDQTLHMPLASVSWSRDIDLREDVSIGDEVSSYTNSSFANAPGVPGSGKSWIGKSGNAIPGIDLDIGKTANPLNLWGEELGWTLPELASAERVGRPIDMQKYAGMQLKYNMDVDEQVYMGDSGLSLTGMLNHTLMTETGNATTGTWASATADQIVADVNELINKVWANAGYALIPDTLLLPPKEYGLLVTRLVSTAGNISILTYLKQNSLTNSVEGRPLNVFPCKWLTGTNASGKGPTATNSMYAYRKGKEYIRIALVPLQRTPLEYRSLRQLTTYYGRIGAVELVYPELCGRRANLS